LRIDVVAVGRLGRTAEAGLVADYLQRATNTGRALALGPAQLIEVEGRSADKTTEAKLLLDQIAPGAAVFACDERAPAETSRQFAERLARVRDGGAPRAVFLIGGADGLTDAVRARADHLLSFGAFTWPHALARVLLAEQIYRATTILAGSPYHRD
jgi:23S rRNA (pseudouridine1915-N3)-methyltransferase